MSWAALGEFIATIFMDAITFAGGFVLAAFIILIVYQVFMDLLPQEQKS